MKETLHGLPDAADVSCAGAAPATASAAAPLSAISSPTAAQPLWRNRDFVVAGSARFMAAAGMGAVVVSVMLHLQETAAGGSTPVPGPWLVAAYLLCSALPLVILAPWAGRLADTKDSRTLAAGSSAVSAAAVAVMGFGMQFSDSRLPVLFAMTFLLDAAQAVAGPTWQALLPRIVGEDRTPRALGTMQATMMIAGMVGPAAGGLLSGWGGAGLVFAVASGCYVAMGAEAALVGTRRSSAAEQAGRRNLPSLTGTGSSVGTASSGRLSWVLSSTSRWARQPMSWRCSWPAPNSAPRKPSTACWQPRSDWEWRWEPPWPVVSGPKGRGCGSCWPPWS